MNGDEGLEGPMGHGVPRKSDGCAVRPELINAETAEVREGAEEQHPPFIQAQTGPPWAGGRAKARPVQARAYSASHGRCQRAHGPEVCAPSLSVLCASLCFSLCISALAVLFPPVYGCFPGKEVETQFMGVGRQCHRRRGGRIPYETPRSGPDPGTYPTPRVGHHGRARFCKGRTRRLPFFSKPRSSPSSS